MRSIILVSALTLAVPAFADDTQTINALGQIAGALSGQNSTSANASLTTQPVLYSDAELKGMDCLGLDLAKTKMSNAVTRTKNNATDLLAAEKAAAGQTKSNSSAAADLAALVLAQRGGKAGEYAKMYQSMQGDPNANSNALDTEIKNLSKMNEQLSEIQVYQKYKNCPGSTTPTPVAAPAPTPVVAQTTPAVAPAAAVAATTKATTTKKKAKSKKKVVKKTT